MRGCGHHARVQPLSGSPASSSPLLGAAIFLPRPSRGKSDASGSSLPAGARRKRRAAAVVRETAGQSGPGAEGPGSEALSRGTRGTRGWQRLPRKGCADGEPPLPAPRPASLAGPEGPGARLGWPAGGCSRAACSYLLVLLDCQGGNGSGDGASIFPHPQLWRYHSCR